ncbi:hypothetical protein CIG19_15070 [Enterobacterales bacterium CwR94]|nr:hypothetical protein CIG19_15070 [Enterobacterales bacterium CwR94]
MKIMHNLPIQHLDRSPTTPLYLNSGVAAPVSGRWTTAEMVNQTLYIERGEVLPQFNGKRVNWRLLEEKRLINRKE